METALFKAVEATDALGRTVGAGQGDDDVADAVVASAYEQKRAWEEHVAAVDALLAEALQSDDTRTVPAAALQAVDEGRMADARGTHARLAAEDRAAAHGRRVAFGVAAALLTGR